MNMKPVLLWTFSKYISFELHTVEVQPGEEVTLQCSNLSSQHVHLSWFRMTNRKGKISSMFSPEDNVTFYEGFQNSKFNMTSNISVLFLEIKQVDSSDSGLYFCGEDSYEKFIVYGATNLKVQGKTDFFSLLIHYLTVFLLLVIIGLIVKIRKFYTGIYLVKLKLNMINDFEHFRLQNVDSDAMNYAALSFPHRAKIRRPVPQRELEPNVVYAATR
uniref:Ig-like domain-containing protein n=1 Tax=Oreochromis niloticus TaxID=8128 RepID=A0A669CNQ9_ORENI